MYSCHWEIKGDHGKMGEQSLDKRLTPMALGAA